MFQEGYINLLDKSKKISIFIAQRQCYYLVISSQAMFMETVTFILPMWTQAHILLLKKLLFLSSNFLLFYMEVNFSWIRKNLITFSIFFSIVFVFFNIKRTRLECAILTFIICNESQKIWKVNGPNIKISSIEFMIFSC